MTTYVLRNGKMVDRDYAPPLVERFGTGPNIISDCMSDTRHMADGKYYSSKAKFREITKAHDCVEVGNDSSLFTPRKPKLLDRDKRRRDIKGAIDQLQAQRRK